MGTVGDHDKDILDLLVGKLPAHVAAVFQRQDPCPEGPGRRSLKDGPGSGICAARADQTVDCV